MFECPDCGWSGEFDNRFAQWCERCGFNAESAPPEPDKRWTARRKGRARARAKELCDQLATAPDLRPTSAAGIAVTVASTLVHLMTAGLVVASVLVIDTWSANYWWARVAGAFGILTAIVVRPQLGRLLREPKGLDESLTRETAPALFALLERCAAPLRAPVPEYVVLNGSFNAETGAAGLRRRKYLVLGVPLWSALTGPQRVALLGHELGPPRQPRRDPRHLGHHGPALADRMDAAVQP